MHRQLRISASVLLGLVAGAMAWRAYRLEEPGYQGRSLSGWLEEYNRAGAMDKTRAASEAIRAMGSRALPSLLNDLKAQDTAFKLKLLAWAREGHIHWLPPPRAEPPSVAPALLALKDLGQTASPAIPQLERMFENPGTSRRGGLGLFSIGPAAIPAFERACASTNAGVRVQAATYLASLPSSYHDNDDHDYSCTWHKFDAWSTSQAYVAPPSSPYLILRLAWRAKNHPNSNVRRACVEALASYYGTVRLDQPAILPTLRKASGDPEASVREAALAALGRLEVGVKTMADTR